MKKYFENCKTAEELKKAYREFAKRLHPDCGGDPEEFKRMGEQFEKAWSRLKDVHTNKEGETYTAREETTETAGEYMDLINELLKLKGIEVEICGSWVWVSGNTYPHRDTLRKMHFQFSKNKIAWFYHRNPYHKKSDREYSMNDIRDMFGSRKFTRKEEEEKKEDPKKIKV